MGSKSELLDFTGGYVGWPTDPGYTETGCPVFENALIDLSGKAARSAHGYNRTLLNKLEDTGTKAAHNGFMICFTDAAKTFGSPGIAIHIVDYKNTSPDRRVVAMGHNPFLKPTDFATDGGEFWDPSTAPVLIVYSYPRTTAHEYPTILNVGKQTFVFAQNLPTMVLDDKGFRPCALLPPTRKPLLRIAGADTQVAIDAAWTNGAGGTATRANAYPCSTSTQGYYNTITANDSAVLRDVNLAYYSGVSSSVGATVTHVGIYLYYEAIGEVLPAGVYSFLMATSDALGGVIHEAVIDQELHGGEWIYVQLAKPSTMSGAVTVESIGIQLNREYRNQNGVLPTIRVGSWWDKTVAQPGPYTGKWRACHTNFHREVGEESSPSPYSYLVDCGTASYSLAYNWTGYRGFWDTSSNSMANDPGAINGESIQKNYPYPYIVTKAAYPDAMFEQVTTGWWLQVYQSAFNNMAIKIYLHQYGAWVSDDGNDTAVFYCANLSGSSDGVPAVATYPTISTGSALDGTNSFTLTDITNAATSATFNNVIVDDVDDIAKDENLLFPYYDPPPSCAVATSIGGRIFCANAKAHDYATTATVIRGKDLIKMSLSSELWLNEANYQQPLELTFPGAGQPFPQTKTYEIIKTEYTGTNDLWVRIGAIPTVEQLYLDEVQSIHATPYRVDQGIGQSTTARVRLAGRKNRVWFSHKTSRFGSQPQYFPPLNYFDVDMDGDEIMGIEKAGDALLIFGRNGVWRCYYDEEALDDDPESAFPISGVTRLDGSPGLMAPRSLKKVDADSLIYLGEGNTICTGGSSGTSVNRPLTNRCRDYLAKDAEVEPKDLQFSHATFDRATNIYRLHMIDNDAATANAAPTFPSAVLNTATPTEDFTKGIDINLNSMNLATLKFEKNKSVALATASRARFCPTCSVEISSAYADSGQKTKRIYVGDRFGYVYEQHEYGYSWGAPAWSTNFANGQQQLRYSTDPSIDTGGFTNGWNSSTKTLQLTASGLVTDGDGLKDLVLMIRTFTAGGVEGSEYHRIASNTTNTITLYTALAQSVSATGSRVMIGVIEPRIQFKHRYFNIPRTPKTIRVMAYQEEGLSHIVDNAQKYKFNFRVFKAFKGNNGREDYYATLSANAGEMEIQPSQRRLSELGLVPIGFLGAAPVSSRTLVYELEWEQEAGKQILRSVEIEEAGDDKSLMLNASA